MTNSLTRTELRWGIGYTLFQLFLLPTLLSPIAKYLHISNWELNVAVFAINFLCTLVIYQRFLQEEWKTVVAAPGKVFPFIPAGLGIYQGSAVLISSLILLICPQYQNLNDANISNMVAQNRLLMVVGTAIFVPPAEEMIFRGLLFRGIYDRSKIAAWVLSVGLFSIVHIVGYIGRYSPLMLLLAFFQYLPAGIVMAFLYKKTGTIIAPILAHASINLIGTLLM